MGESFQKGGYCHGKKDNVYIDYSIQGDPDLRCELFHGAGDPGKIQVVASSMDQKNYSIIGSYSGTTSDDPSNLVP